MFVLVPRLAMYPQMSEYRTYQPELEIIIFRQMADMQILAFQTLPPVMGTITVTMPMTTTDILNTEKFQMQECTHKTKVHVDMVITAGLR